ncbi:MAG: aldehyde ferredoxin oxidoreductase N-terminal domain-containing protein [Anaerosomatales bacterium]|nr:aldehyde ferredoxin oxidoreductase N-terminal domain-containing protein [Anaerosomatales bacterium]
MANGYAGKILVVDLSSGEISSLDTADYAEYGGGHGMGSAVFFDLCEDKTISAFDPANVITFMSGPIQGTLAPFGAGRCEVQAIGPQPWPVEWFTRSNFGGRFSGMLKFAGWDGIAVTGKAEKPVWIDIRDSDVTVRDASETGDALWGLGTYDAESRIYELVRGGEESDWTTYGASRDSGRLAQNPAVVSCGQAGENLVRYAALIHEGGGGAGQGGFGAVFGSKNLKAISVIGTGQVAIADPQALMEARAWWHENYFDWDDYKPSLPGLHSYGEGGGGGNQSGGALRNVGQRPIGCMGCTKLCHGGRSATAEMPGSSCFDTWYQAQSGVMWGNPAASPSNTDLLQQYGINAWEPSMQLPWLVGLYKQGILGPGKEIDSNLPFDQVGSDAFNAAFLDCIVNGTDIGADLKEGAARAATKWGRYEQDVTSGDLAIAMHGYAHHYDARTEFEWGAGSALGDRDINEHDITWVLYWHTSMAPLYGQPQALPAKEMVEMIGATLLPYADPMMLDFSDEGIYSDNFVKFVSWHRAYTRFWKQSAMYCDWGITDWLNPWADGYKGLTPEIEPRFYNAVTGSDTSFEQGVEMGTKIWNLDRAIWYLQGRKPEHDLLAEWQFRRQTPAAHSTYEIPYIMPVYENGEWAYKNLWGRTLDHAKYDDFLKRYYAFEGWDANGCPTAETLKKHGLDKAADELAAAGIV